MRLVLVAVVVAAALSLPAAAAGLDPRALVLRQSDVPAGFVFDEQSSSYRSNAREADGDPSVIALFRRWGRLNGYEAVFERSSARVESRVDVFRKRGSVRSVLAWYDRELRKSPSSMTSRSRTRVGEQGWVYRMSSPLVGRFTLVVWRFGRVFAGVVAYGITSDRTLELARVQQRRIAAALG